jgi:hypothetical protein
MISYVLWIRSLGQTGRPVLRPIHKHGSLEHETQHYAPTVHYEQKSMHEKHSRKPFQLRSVRQ